MKKHLLTVLLCAFLISLAGCSGKTPEPPDNITAVPEGETVKISWTPSDNAVCYRLYRKTERASDYKYLCDLQNTEYTDTDVLPGDSYRYKVEIFTPTAFPPVLKRRSLPFPCRHQTPNVLH